MAYSYKEYIGDGSLTTFTTPPYLEQSHIRAIIGGEHTTAFTLSGTSLTFDTAPAGGVEIRIVRSSSSAQRLTDYADASLLTADTLDLDSNQLFYLTQEALDTASETNISGAKFYTASTAVPSDPVTGNLWFDINIRTLKIYDGNVWKLAVPTNSSHTFETFSNDEANYSYVSLTTVDNSALVFLNGVKQVRSENKAGLLTVPTTGDYWVDETYNRIYFATLSATDVVEVVVNLINNTGGTNTITTTIGGGDGGGGSGLSLTQQLDGNGYVLTDSFNSISVIIADGNDSSVPIPTVVDNGNGTYTIDNGMGDVVTFSDGYTPVKNFDYYDGDSGAYKSFIFYSSENQPSTPTGGTFDGLTETFPAVAGSTPWYDTPTASDVDIEWVSSTRYVETNGVWSNNGWSAPRLYFRQGADGSDGTSVNIKGTFATTAGLENLVAELGDGYIVGGNLYVCTTASTGADSEITDFTDVGQFVGAAGENNYIHYAYASAPFGAPASANFSDSDPVGRDYLGVLVDHNLADSQTVGDYTWSLIKGADGVSIDWKGSYTFRDTQVNSFEVLNAPLVNGMAYHDLTAGKSYIYQDSAYYQVAQDGYSGTDGVDGMVWKGELAVPPTIPEWENGEGLPTYANGTPNHMAAANWAYKDTSEAYAGKVFIYDAVGQAWELMVESGTNGEDGIGVDGMNVYVIYHDNDINTQPALPHRDFIPYINTANAGTYPSQGWSLTSSPDTNWMSQNTGRQNHSFDQDWSAPIRISGSNGVDGDHGSNGAGQFSGNMVSDSYTHLQATAVVRALAQRDPVIGDVVTLSEINNRTNSVTKICNAVTELGNGEFNDTVVLHIDGSLLVDGTIVGSKILAGTIDSTHISAGSISATSITADSLDVGGKAISGSIGMCEGVAGVSIVMSGWDLNSDYFTADFADEAPYHMITNPDSPSHGAVMGLPYFWFKEGTTPAWQTATLFSDGVWAPILNHWQGNANGSIANFTGVLPDAGGDIQDFTTPVLMKHSFTTHNFKGSQSFIIDWSASVTGYFTPSSIPTFAMAVRETTDPHAYMSTDAADYVSTSIVYGQGETTSGTTNMNELVSLEGGKTYHIWIFGFLQDVWLINSTGSTADGIVTRVGDHRGISNGKITVQGLNA